MKLVTLHQIGISVAIAGAATSVMATVKLVNRDDGIETFAVLFAASMLVSLLTKLGPPARRRWRLERKSPAQ